MSLSDEEEEFFDALTKQYLTTEEKLELIKEYNSTRREEEWQEILNELRRRGYFDDGKRP